MRSWLVALGLVLALGLPGAAIVDKERRLADGTPVLLELAPVDPRSLMQGDYMRLRYRLTAELADRIEAPVMDGLAIVALDPDGVATLIRIGAANEALAAGEIPLRFRKRGRNVRIATDAFFFQEGHAERYSGARYGDLRVSADGEAILTGLRDRARTPLVGAAP